MDGLNGNRHQRRNWDGWRMYMMISVKWKWKDGEDRWRIEKNGGRLFRRPKLTLSCSALRKWRMNYIDYTIVLIIDNKMYQSMIFFIWWLKLYYMIRRTKVWVQQWKAKFWISLPAFSVHCSLLPVSYTKIQWSSSGLWLRNELTLLCRLEGGKFIWRALVSTDSLTPNI
jgi:hypothetical protein